MTLSKLANECAKSMFKSYYSENKTLFTINYFEEIFPKENKETITQAIITLENENLVRIFYADGIAYSTTLLPEAIKQNELDTWIKKGYRFAKEVWSWVNP